LGDSQAGAECENMSENGEIWAGQRWVESTNAAFDFVTSVSGLSEFQSTFEALQKS
jgi:hypothetical protein